MPDLDGWTLLARLRERPATATLPILLMAGVLEEVDEARLAAASAQGFLRKPTEFRELADRVRSLLASLPPSIQVQPAARPFQDLVELDLETLQASAAGTPPERAEPRSQDAAEAFLRALRADPLRMDALARAVAARLHEPAMRELVRDLVLDLNLPKP
jgi:DNA-binding response OmpR family regulator